MNRLLLTYGTIAAGLFITWTFLLFMPAMSRSNHLKQELQTAARTVQQLEQEVAQLPGILETKDILTEAEERLATDLFTSREILSLLDKIGRQCDAHRLGITEVRPPVEELILLQRTHHPAGEPQFLNITLVLEGEFARFGQFVTELERAPYFRGVNYSRLQSAAVSGAPSQFLIEFKVLLGRISERRG